MSKILVYTDGSTKPKNPGPCGCGAVFLKDGIIFHKLYAFLGEGTNNIAELTGVKLAIEYLKLHNLDWEDCTIFTDSSYVVGLITKNWKAQKNQDLVAEILKLSSSSPNIDVQWIKGHANNTYNEMADQLANEAVDTESSLGV